MVLKAGDVCSALLAQEVFGVFLGGAECPASGEAQSPAGQMLLISFLPLIAGYAVCGRVGFLFSTMPTAGCTVLQI